MIHRQCWKFFILKKTWSSIISLPSMETNSIRCHCLYVNVSRLMMEGSAVEYIVQKALTAKIRDMSSVLMKIKRCYKFLWSKLDCSYVLCGNYKVLFIYMTSTIAWYDEHIHYGLHVNVHFILECLL